MILATCTFNTVKLNNLLTLVVLTIIGTVVVMLVIGLISYGIYVYKYAKQTRADVVSPVSPANHDNATKNEQEWKPSEQFVQEDAEARFEYEMQMAMRASVAPQDNKHNGVHSIIPESDHTPNQSVEHSNNLGA